MLICSTHLEASVGEKTRDREKTTKVRSQETNTRIRDFHRNPLLLRTSRQEIGSRLKSIFSKGAEPRNLPLFFLELHMEDDPGGANSREPGSKDILTQYRQKAPKYGVPETKSVRKNNGIARYGIMAHAHTHTHTHAHNPCSCPMPP